VKSAFLNHISDSLSEIKSAGLYKTERQIVSQQAGHIDVQQEDKQHKRVVNLCATTTLTWLVRVY